MTWRRRRIATLALAASVAAAGLVACAPAPAGPAVVVLFPGGPGDAWGASAEVLRDELAAGGYSVEVRFAGDDIPAQLEQLSTALASEPVAIVIAPVDATSIAAELAGSAAAAVVDDEAEVLEAEVLQVGDGPTPEPAPRDVSVIAYDRLILDAPEVDYFATFDHRAAGRMRAEALLAALGITSATVPEGGPLAIELLAGSVDDPSALASFEGSLEVLQPYLASGVLVVPSERIEFEHAAILRGSPETARERVATLAAELAEQGVSLAGVLSPRDDMSAAVLDVLPGVVVTGGGQSLAGARAVADGHQSSTVYEDPRALARTVASMVREVVRGAEPTVTQGATSDNGARLVPTRLLEPRIIATELEALAFLAAR